MDQKWWCGWWMVVFETHTAKGILCWFWGGAPTTDTSVLHRPEKVVWVRRMGWLKRTMLKNVVRVLGWRSKHP